ncbi:MAG: alpha/beta hydrolase [Chloroflexia bacterium]|nr:alpha/beta hydrolase [Chloroflexia bacterium]
MAERSVDVNGATLWVAETGQGDPVILCNGGPGCCDYLEPVASMLDDRSLVYRWEQRGCGRSSAEGPFDLATTLRDLDGLRNALGHDRWIVGGHSWGATLALIYAMAFPERTHAVIMIAGRGLQNDRSWQDAYHTGRDAGLDQVPTMAYPYNHEVNRVLNADSKTYIRRPTLWRDLANLRVPALIVDGATDIRPSWPNEQIAELLPCSTYLRIEGAGHCPWFTHAGELRDHLQGFLHTLPDRTHDRARR